MTDLAKLAKILFLIYFAGKFGLLTLLFLPNGKVQKILNDVNNIQILAREFLKKFVWKKHYVLVV